MAISIFTEVINNSRTVVLKFCYRKSNVESNIPLKSKSSFILTYLKFEVLYSIFTIQKYKEADNYR